MGLGLGEWGVLTGLRKHTLGLVFETALIGPATWLQMLAAPSCQLLPTGWSWHDAKDDFWSRTCARRRYSPRCFSIFITIDRRLRAKPSLKESKAWLCMHGQKTPRRPVCVWRLQDGATTQQQHFQVTNTTTTTDERGEETYEWYSELPPTAGVGLENNSGNKRQSSTFSLGGWRRLPPPLPACSERVLFIQYAQGAPPFFLFYILFTAVLTIKKKGVWIDLSL